VTRQTPLWHISRFVALQVFPLLLTIPLLQLAFDYALSCLRGAQYMETARGSKLLISGWWGMARKINYTVGFLSQHVVQRCSTLFSPQAVYVLSLRQGDWLMGLSWCLCCGTKAPFAFFYAVYFLGAEASNHIHQLAIYMHMYTYMHMNSHLVGRSIARPPFYARRPFLLCEVR
jgi:hypothetical protein